MRVRLPIGRSLFFMAAFLLSLAALVPLRLAAEWLGLPAHGVSAREVRGSAWFGTLREAQAGRVGLGDLHVALRGLPLLIGTARVAVERGADQAGAGSAAGLRGAMEVTRYSFGVDDLVGRLQLAGALGTLPVSQVELGDVSARFEAGQCAEAAGAVRAAVAGDVAGMALPGGLTGVARCDGGALLLPLASQSGMETVELRLFGDGRYRATILVRSTDPALRDRMAASGFVMTSAGYGLTVDGRF